MSETFKYLEKDNWGAENAAQQFMESRMAKNKFTEAQNSELMRNGGPAVVDASEGVVPEGGAYDRYGPLNGSDGTDGGNSGSAGGSTDTYRGFDPKSDSGRNYSTGAWGKGSLDAEALAAKYGLDRSQEGRGEGHIWGRDSNGNDVYIGKSSMDLASNSGLIGNHSKQANPDEVDHSGSGSDLSSYGDIKGAILVEWDGGGAKKAGGKTEGRKPIEHSPEVRQAKERVRAYEDGVMSGKTSDSIFNSGSDTNDAINSRYTLDLNKGAAGIGTPRSGSQPASRATENFLASKTADVKNKYQFEAK